MIESVRIKNFKSVKDVTLNLGRVNVLIGANGTGKSNLIEAVAMLSAKVGDEIDLESMNKHGIRIARPDLMVNSFFGKSAQEKIGIELTASGAKMTYSIKRSDGMDIYAPWMVEMKQVAKKYDEVVKKIASELSRFAIYTPSVDALRGLTSSSMLMPVGLNGEGLDVLLSQLPGVQVAEIKAMVAKCIEWVDDICFDAEGAYKLQGFKMGRSKSNLYFRDRFMQVKNNLFSAENANEGVLELLFFATLLISDKTPKIMAIDNIEASLNPRLCRFLMKEMAHLALEKHKQVFVTTHNPAILDGMVVGDEMQKLFVVDRNDDGYTVVREIKAKPAMPDGKPVKMSQMWMDGLIGGLPSNF